KFHGHFLGCAVGDYDNDGYDDIYISGYRTGLLLHNERGKTFKDVTAGSGLATQPWGTSCAWGDFDNDGRLDLYVGDYVQFDPKTSKRLCEARGTTMVCNPSTYLPEHGALYHNEGHGKFQDVTNKWQASGFGKTLGVAFADYDRTGRQSLMLANDTLPADLLSNVGGKFRNAGRESGTAFNGHNVSYAGMGLDWGDYDNDGKIDLTVMAFYGEPKCIYHNVGNGLFEEISDTLALTGHTQDSLAFGCKWLDYDNDGWLDLMITNGHVYDNVDAVDKLQKYRQPTQLFHNDHGRLFVDMSGAAGPSLQKPIVGRGLAVGDFDNDGRVDALVVDSEGVPLLLHNESQNVGHWLSIKLTGVHSNRDGYGAQVTAAAGGLTQTRICHTDGSYLSASDGRVHLGLGAARTVDTLTVRWPSGHVDVLHHVPADRFLTLREGQKLVLSHS
ncbi:MAG: CRTAC1 family protein, partial [Armatimonadota bacterium]|nr:CRTAC1 family protein [Armatimonadota bacterium]